jgi:conjugal transfer pilus assembly protein TraE
MFFKKYLSDSDNTNQEIRFLRVVVGGLLLLTLFNGGAIWKLIGTEKTVLVPPDIRRTFWVSGDTVSKEYLEEMAYWYAGLALNITPAVSDYQHSMFLKFAAPSESGRLQVDMGARAEFLKKNNVATQFSVTSMTPDEVNLRVALSGTLYTWAGDKKVDQRPAIYMVGFKFVNGKLNVADFKETSAQNQFGNPAPVQPATGQS